MKRVSAVIIGIISILASLSTVHASYTVLDVPGTTTTGARGIDGSNIVGDYHDGSGYHGFLYDGTTYPR